MLLFPDLIIVIIIYNLYFNIKILWDDSANHVLVQQYAKPRARVFDLDLNKPLAKEVIPAFDKTVFGGF